MRKMISGTKARALDNIVVSEDGTLVEIGGNVAFESAEQICISVQEPLVYQADFDYAMDTPPVDAGKTIATDLRKVEVLAGTVEEIPTDVPLLVENSIVSYDGEIYWYVKSENKAYSCSSQFGCKIRVYGNCHTDINPGSWSNKQEGTVTVGKPLFKYVGNDIQMLNASGTYVKIN